MLFQNPHFKSEYIQEEQEEDSNKARGQLSIERRTMGSTDIDIKCTFNPSSFLPRNTSGATTTSVKSLISRYEDLRKGHSYLKKIEGIDEGNDLYNGKVKEKINKFEETITRVKTSPKRTSYKQKSVDFTLENYMQKKPVYEQNFFDDMSVLDSSLNSSTNNLHDFDGKKNIFDNPLISGNKADMSISNTSHLDETKNEKGKLPYILLIFFLEKK